MDMRVEPTTLVVEALVRRADERDAAAERRDRALTADPCAHTAAEVAVCAAADRAAAARDREILLRLLLGPGAGTGGPTSSPCALTRREMQVLEGLARAMSTKAIAADLYLSPNSVKTHTQSLYRKIGVTSRAQAALWARDHGIG